MFLLAAARVQTDLIFASTRYLLLVAERLNNQNYGEYRQHQLFSDADWATLEKAEAIVSYEPAWELLLEVAGKFQPKPDIPKKDKRDKSHLWKLDALQVR